MTLDSNVQATYGDAIAQLRDNIGGMTNWTVVDTSTDGGATPMPTNEWFVVEAPNGEAFKVVIGAGEDDDLQLEHGPDYDTGGSWNTRYSNDIRTRSRTDENGDEMGFQPASNNQTDMGSTGNFWMCYADGVGWMWYFERSEGDGNDEAVMLGVSQINKLWDYTTAANVESEYTTAAAGAMYEREYNGDTVNEAYLNVMSESDAFPQDSNTRTGFGQVNPDGNFGNYPVVEETIVSSSQYRNADNNDAVIGTHTLWIRDESGGDAAHQDTVQDSGGNDLYEVLKAHDSVPPIGMRYV